MGVSRLDSFQILKNLAQNTTGTPSAQEIPLTNMPVNGLVSVHAFGTFGGGAFSIEVTADGINWVPAVTAPTTLAAAGVVTWQGDALGVRGKLTGATSPLLNAIAVFNDQG